jgi:hypothetical protein
MQIRDIAHFKSGLYLLILLIDNFTVNWFVQCPSRLYFGRLTFADYTVTKNRLKIPIYSWRLTIEHDFEVVLWYGAVVVICAHFVSVVLL